MTSLTHESTRDGLSALCFDAMGTLIETTEPVGEVYRRVALEFGVDLPAWRLEDAFRRILRHAPPRGLDGDTPAARCQAEVEWWHERIRQTFQATDSTVRFADFPAFAAALFDRYRQAGAWRVRPGVAEMLARLRARGWPLGLVSNFDHRLHFILQDLGIEEDFYFLGIPSTVGFAKPDRHVFESAASRLGQPISRLGYVGDDSPETLEAIARLGVRVFDAREIGSWADFTEQIAVPAKLRSASGPTSPRPASGTMPSPATAANGREREASK
jgi:putative hydrolase of the HAD superfamily